jgi:hypothetical protein
MSIANQNTPNKWHHLLWVDCIAGGIVGVVVVLASYWLSKWYQLPQSLVLFTGIANLAYGCYSFFLARQSNRPKVLVIFLVVANMFWAIFCVYLGFVYRDTASWLGIAHLVLEALFVGGLAILEWRWRKVLWAN